MNRLLGIAFGVANQLLFAYTVVRLFLFLNGGHTEAAPGSLWWDTLLAAQFAAPHSLLLWPPVRERLRAWIAAEFYGCSFCAVTCLSLLTLFAGWRSDPRTIWDLHGVGRAAVQTGFLLSWGALFYSLWLSGLGRQTGWTTWYAWLRRVPASTPEFAPRSWYRWLRHPIYMSFLGLIWFTPQMTLDRAVLTVIWTGYVFIGSWLKDRRLEQYVGEAYRLYETRVPGFPFFLFGPLGRRSARPASAAQGAFSQRNAA
ncbi:MAG: NnrU family protein [Planctomycetaceae bacterium]